MNNKYNILITYSGDDEFRFMIKRIGEVSITRTRPVYIYNADVDTINNLRLLRRMLIEIKIGAKPEGAYKIYNLDDYNRKEKVLHRDINLAKPSEDILSNAEVKSILKNHGPIVEETVEEPVEELNTVEVEEIETEPIVESEVTEPETPEKEEVIEPVKKSTNKKSNKKKSKKSSKK